MSKEQLRPIVELLRARARKIPSSIIEHRKDFDAFAAPFAVADGVVRACVNVGHVGAEWITPSNVDAKTVLYYLHGGGYIIGSIDTHLGLIARLARAAEARAFAINYRLAPENPHPAAVEDALAGYRWLLAHGVDHKHLVVAGDSAGGGLVLSTLVAVRDAALPLPACAVCMSPWTDLACTGDSMRRLATSDPVIQKTGAQLYAQWFLGGAPPTDPLASPLYADVHGLPPILIQVGACEVLLDDSTRMAARLRESGVEVRLDIWDDMVHVWQFFAGQLEEGQQAVDAAGQFVRAQIRVSRRT